MNSLFYLRTSLSGVSAILMGLQTSLQFLLFIIAIFINNASISYNLYYRLEC